MASMSLKPLPRDPFSSIAAPRKYTSLNGFKSQPCSHAYALSPLKRAPSPESCSIPLVKCHASRIAERMPHGEQTDERKSRNLKTHDEIARKISSLRSVIRKVGESFGKDEERLELADRKQNYGSKNGGSKDFGEVGASRFPSTRSRDDGGHRKGKKTGVTATVVERVKDVQKNVEENMAKRNKKDKVNTEEIELRVRLDMCSKKGDVMGAIKLYDWVVRDGVKLEQYHYNVLLYLCSAAAIGVIHPAKSGTTGNINSSSSLSFATENSCQQADFSGYAEEEKSVAVEQQDTTEFQSESSASRGSTMSDTYGCPNKDGHGTPIQVGDDVRDFARTKGFEIYEKMCLEGISMSEAALTSVARIAMSMGMGDVAFEIVKRMKVLGITPRLRSYGPALFAFCSAGDIDKAFEVEVHMLESRVCPEEPELEALLRACVKARRGDKVYYLLHKLRTHVRRVSASTADLIEEWFKSTTASKVGKRKWDREIVARVMVNGGGGWHGLGWLGNGKWTVQRTEVDEHGMCLGCGEKLVTIDLDPIETENFARSVASIACKRERNSSFQKFQKWLDYYGPFEAVVDAANIGLFNQRKFSINKVNAVVNGIRQKLPSKKWPLIIVHNKRLTGARMNEPVNVKLVEKWKNADAIYATPTGSNDDWYWLYAAIKCKCLIVTNDEMRDHIFQILGNDFFPKWKERHQVHFSSNDGSFKFHMPPPCSVNIQESEEGHWHIPIAPSNKSERERTWLCVTRAQKQVESHKSLHRSTSRKHKEEY